jgi:hypothetical protein
MGRDDSSSGGGIAVSRDFLQQVAQDSTVKLEAGIATAAVTSSWWLPHFDTVIHVLLGVGGVALIGSRVAIMWLQYKNNKTGR